MQETARSSSVVKSTIPARRRLIRDVLAHGSPPHALLPCLFLLRCASLAISLVGCYDWRFDSRIKTEPLPPHPQVLCIGAVAPLGSVMARNVILRLSRTSASLDRA